MYAFSEVDALQHVYDILHMVIRDITQLRKAITFLFISAPWLYPHTPTL